ncbi:MAG: Do family serine endopeptidase [Prevotella sp.]|uniref:Do family serine endopeptidase n=1 Tax=Prevotella sp. TaxID=59823 RepID=UPI002A2E5343|nr:Do family serine endopeptidase [Prevotella sp.]MDD7318682.1 Do family serine endopeptidase [Prevotellaceae bacterium]MDY4019362.1 Do family serine endopeptidase [Prevotella sp.]
MKRFKNILLYSAVVMSLAFSAGAFIRVNAACSATMAPPVAGQPVDLTYAADKALPAVVHIRYLQNSKVKEVEVESNPFDDFFGPFGFFGNPGGQGGKQRRQVQTPKREASGSGVIISPDGYIVTNNHVVNGADELTVTLNDNREFSARIIGTDELSDLALIKIDGKNLPTLPIGDSDKLKVGEWVLAVGNPFNLTSTVTAGIVSAKARSLGANGVESFIQTDAAINSGNSGGALVNTNGELVGINAMLYSQTGNYSGYGFAIPTTIMNKVVEDLKTYGTVQRAVIGITGSDVHNYIDEQKRKDNEVDLGTNDGIYIAEVQEGSAGEDAGLQKGDVIIAIDGKKVTKMAELQENLANKRPGDKVQITYLRKKNKKTTDLVLKNAQGNTKIMKEADMDVLGAMFREVNEQEKRELEISYGLKVTNVTGGVMKGRINKGFIILSVNKKPMNSVSDLQKEVKAVSKSDEPVLQIKGIQPSGRIDYIAVPLDQE